MNENGVSILRIAEKFEISADDLRQLFMTSGKDVDFYNKYVSKGIVSNGSLSMFEHVVQEKLDTVGLPFVDAEPSSNTENSETEEDAGENINPFTGETDNGFRDTSESDIPDGFKEEPVNEPTDDGENNTTIDNQSNSQDGQTESDIEISADNEENKFGTVEEPKKDEAETNINNSEKEDKTEKKTRKRKKTVVSECEIKSDINEVPALTLRGFVAQNFNIKAEKALMMTDKKILNMVDEKYIVLKSNDKCHFIKRSYNIISMDIIDDDEAAE